MEGKVGLLVFAPYYPPHVGGLESHAHEFNIHASGRGYDITVWTARLPNHIPEYEEVDSIKIFRYPVIELLGGFPVPAIWSPTFRNQYKEISSRAYEVVISRTRFFLSSCIALTYAKIKDIPLLHIEHGSDYVHLHSILATAVAYAYDQTFGRLVIQKADIVVANSNASATFVQNLTQNSVHPHVIYRGVKQDAIINAIADKKTSDAITICYVGRLINGKGVQDLVTALSILSVTSRVVCWIIGDGPMKKELEQLSTRYNLESKIIFLGQMNNDQAISYIKSCDIFINPSYTEGIPTSVIEAALCKRAIIATDVGGTNEIITHNESGILIAPHASKEMAEALALLITNPELRQKIGKEAYNQNKSRFSWEHAMNQYEAILR
ncbi:MAG: glycosyltransferase family 4 protein [Candidatus Andersenbacteria bacterium]|nr:glycosyltransferase family 4 protein [Candidatus Andersenbacteria bacterium]